MSLSSITPIQTIGVPSQIQPIRPVEAPTAAPAPLDPAVRVDIRANESLRTKDASDESAARAARPAADERRITVDEDTKALVYQLVDPSSGDVVVQLPEPTVLKARAYAEAARIRTEAAGRPLDRTA